MLNSPYPLQWERAMRSEPVFDDLVEAEVRSANYDTTEHGLPPRSIEEIEATVLADLWSMYQGAAVGTCAGCG